jgi:flagellin-specific chaperone FliS
VEQVVMVANGALQVMLEMELLMQQAQVALVVQQVIVQAVTDILHGLLQEIDMDRWGKHNVEYNTRICRLVHNKRVSI